MLDSITGSGDAHPIWNATWPCPGHMDLFDEPMKILMLARHLAGRMWKSMNVANKLQAGNSGHDERTKNVGAGAARYTGARYLSGQYSATEKQRARDRQPLSLGAAIFRLKTK